MPFINLPIPSSGAGASVDTSTIGSEKTFTFAGPGGLANKALVLEGSNDAGATFVPVLQVTQYGDQGAITFHGTWQRMRLNLVSGSAPTAASVGGATETTAFLILDSSGLDSSALGSDATFAIAGKWQGTVVVEGSDDGVNFNPSPIIFFNAGGSDFKNLLGAYKKLRARLLGLGTFAASVGTSTPPGTGGGGAKAQICLDAFVEAYDHSLVYEQFVRLNDDVDHVVARWTADFDRLSTPSIDVELTFFNAIISGDGTVKVIVGGTPTDLVGTVVATVVVPSSSIGIKSSGVLSIARPSGNKVIKLVARSAGNMRIEAVFLVFSDQ